MPCILYATQVAPIYATQVAPIYACLCTDDLHLLLATNPLPLVVVNGNTKAGTRTGGAATVAGGIGSLGGVMPGQGGPRLSHAGKQLLLCLLLLLLLVCG